MTKPKEVFGNEESKPTPDPTILTTEQLLREIARLEKLVEQSDASANELVQCRITGLRELMLEKFKSQENLAELKEKQRLELKEADRISLNAALAAAEKAVTANNEAVDKANLKTERETGEKLGLQSSTFGSGLSGVTALLQQLTTRVEKIENIKQGGMEQVSAFQQETNTASQQINTQRSTQQVILAAAAIIMSLFVFMVGTGITLYLALKK